MPLFFRALTKNCFCFGVTRPNTVYFEAAEKSFLGVEGGCVHVNSGIFNAGRSRAISATVSGLSPDITFTVTSCFSKYLKVALAFLRMEFDSTIRALGSTFAERAAFCGSTGSSCLAKTRTRYPFLHIRPFHP